MLGFIFLFCFCVLPAFHLFRKGWMDNNELQYARESRCPNLKKSVISSFRNSLTLQTIMLKGIDFVLSPLFGSAVLWDDLWSIIKFININIYSISFYFLSSFFVFLSLLLAFSIIVFVLNIMCTCSPCPGKFSELLKCGINTSKTLL